MKRIVIESPYAGDVERNTDYARRAMGWALRQGVAPFASHLLYTQPGVLDDSVPDERTAGIEAGLAFVRDCDETWVFIDHGISRGMEYGIGAARKAGRPVRKFVGHIGNPGEFVEWSVIPLEDQ
jgi:hypothetical protein